MAGEIGEALRELGEQAERTAQIIEELRIEMERLKE
jgi:hypothetical protein